MSRPGSPEPGTLLPDLAHNVPALDGVRGIAILTVLGHQLILNHAPHAHSLNIIDDVLESGWLGVQIFFVLSGFLITGILLDSKASPRYFGSFYARRVLRIFPTYYLLLAVVFFLVAPPAPVSRAMYWLYVSNWAPAAHLAGERMLSHCWSLAVEEQFYLLWPVIVFVMSPRGLARLSVALAAAALAVRIGLQHAGASSDVLYESTVTRMDALAFGALAAVVARDRDWYARLAPRLPLLAALAAAALAVVALASGLLARVNPVTLTVGHTVIAVASALLILLVADPAARGRPVERILSSPLLRRFGKHSYAIYIMHLPLNFLVQERVLGPLIGGASDLGLVAYQVGYYVVGIAGLLALSIAYYHLFERRVLALKRYFPVA